MRLDLIEMFYVYAYLLENGLPYYIGKVQSIETKKKHSDRMAGAGNHMFGKTLSEEHKLKKSIAMKLYYERKRNGLQ